VSGELEHRFDGDPSGSPLMLANSLGAELGMWDEQMPAFAPSFRVLRYNHRGHGGSPAPPGPYSIESLARDALDLLDRHEIEQADFAGVSLGGMVGLWLAINAAQRIGRLVLCSTTAYGGGPEMWLERAATVREQGMSAVTEPTLERWFTAEFLSSHPDRVDQIRKMLLRTDPEGYAGCCEAIAEHDLRARLGDIVAPTLIITAAGDPSIVPEVGQLLADAIPKARLLALREGRHLVSLERADEVAGALLEHLSGDPRR
jgi:3-oxoadipate enol-lactonase